MDKNFPYNLLAVGQDCDDHGALWIFGKHGAVSISEDDAKQLFKNVSEVIFMKTAQRKEGGLYILNEDPPNSNATTTYNSILLTDISTCQPCLASGIRDITVSSDKNEIWHALSSSYCRLICTQW